MPYTNGFCCCFAFLYCSKILFGCAQASVNKPFHFHGYLSRLNSLQAQSTDKRLKYFQGWNGYIFLKNMIYLIVNSHGNQDGICLICLTSQTDYFCIISTLMRNQNRSYGNGALSLISSVNVLLHITNWKQTFGLFMDFCGFFFPIFFKVL